MNLSEATGSWIGVPVTVLGVVGGRCGTEKMGPRGQASKQNHNPNGGGLRKNKRGG
jgi:hypothetical protein